MPAPARAIAAWQASAAGSAIGAMAVASAYSRSIARRAAASPALVMQDTRLARSYAEAQSPATAIAGTMPSLQLPAKAPAPTRAPALAIAAILATPYSLDYDLMTLSVAIAFLAADGFARGFAPYEKSALALLWLAPLVARSIAEATLIPLGVIAMLIVLALLLRRGAADLAANGGRWDFAASR